LEKLSSETRAFSLELLQNGKEVRHGWKLY
jgi:hypothetical protein